MTGRFYILFLIFSFFLWISVCSQDISFSYKNLTIENGLSSNRITSFLQDKKGFLWIGTEDGLNRFDGYSFKTYLNRRGDKNSLSHNYIWSLCEDKMGNIWIATNGGGLNKFDPVYEKFYHYRNNPTDSTSLSSDIVQCVYIDKENNIWTGTWGDGLNFFNIETNSFIRYKNNPDDPSSLSSNKIWCIYEDSKNNLWIGTDNGGLNLFDRNKKSFKRYLPETGSLNSITGYSAVTLLEDTRGNLWVGTYGEGLDRYDYKTETFTNYKANSTKGSISGNFIWKVFEDNQGLIWIATQSSGINIYDYKSNEFSQVTLDQYNPEGVSSNNGRALFEDRSFNLWIGTIVGGIYKTDRKPKKFATIKKIPGNNNSLPEDFIFTMCEDKTGDIWIGTYSYLSRYARSSNKFITYPVNKLAQNSIAGEIVRYIFQDSYSDVWIGTYFGKLNKYDRQTDTFIKFNLDFNNDNPSANNVRVIYEDNEGILWFGSNGDGLIRYDKENNNFEVFDTKSSGISGDGVLSVIEDKEGYLWIGTFSKGLNKFDKKNKSFVHYLSDENDSSSLSDNSVTELYVDSKGILWVGTFSGGLCRYDSYKNNFKIYKEEDGLAGNFICGILEDDNYNLWISTSKGISKFSPASNVFKNYDFSDGLQKGEFNPAARLKTRDGTFYFGGLNGINFFHPDSLTNTSPVAPVLITSFKVQNNDAKLPKNITYTDTIFLNFDEDNFSFEFASLDFTYPEKNKYAYMLDGLDEDWNYTANRRYASYTHLDPGEYLFKAKGTNNEGVWNEEGTTLLLIIKPPFWATWWFRSIMFAGLVGIVGFIYKRRITSLKKDKKAQEDFSKRLIQSQEQERKRIASELHDSIGQNLLIIKNYASLGKKIKDAETGIKQFEEISNNAASTIDEVRRIAYNLHPYHLERLGLTNAVLSIIDNAEASSQINFKIKSDNIDNTLSKESEINLFRVIQESINNIIKHSHANNAEIIIEKKDNRILISIKDDGKGFAVSSEITPLDRDLEGDGIAKGFGLENLKKRINIIKGEININSEPGKGTEVSIKIPV